MDMEQRERIYRKLQAAAAELLRKAPIGGVYIIAMIPEPGGYLHVIDAGAGEQSADFPAFLRMIASSHEKRDAGLEEGYLQ